MVHFTRPKTARATTRPPSVSRSSLCLARGDRVGIVWLHAAQAATAICG